MKSIVIFHLSLTISFAQTPPGPRHTEQIAFDSHRKTLIMYGGGEFPLNGDSFSPNDFNEWKNGVWKRYNSSGPQLNRMGLVYNSDEKAIMLIGGITKTESGETIQQDVWKWSGSNWQKLGNGCPQTEMETVYDPINKRVLAYGNANVNTGKRLCELWEYKQGVWKKLSTDAPLFSTSDFAPYEIAYDSKRNSLILPVWENNSSVIWEWKNEAWQKNVCTGDCPGERYYFSLAYHERDKATYMFGGRSNTSAFLDELWKWDGQWTKIESTEKPKMRCAATMEYAYGGLLLYGGVAEWGTTNEMWQWKNGSWKLLNGEYAMDATRKMDSLKYLIEKYPANSNLFYEYGSMLNRFTDRKDEAEAAFKKAVLLEPTHAMRFYYLIDFLLKQNKPEEVEKYIQEALTPGKPQNYYYFVGRVLIRSKRYAQGVPFYEKASELMKGDDLFNLGCAYASINNVDKAFEALKRAIEVGYNNKMNYETNVDLSSLKQDQRWSDLLTKLK